MRHKSAPDLYTRVMPKGLLHFETYPPPSQTWKRALGEMQSSSIVFFSGFMLSWEVCNLPRYLGIFI